MSECELARGLRVELEEARKRIKHAENISSQCCADEAEAHRQRDEAIRERDELTKKLRHYELESFVYVLKTDYEAILKERDSLREEIARRDAEKPVTEALSWVEKTEHRIGVLEAKFSGVVEGTASRIDNAEKTLRARLSKLEARVSKKRVKK